VIAEAAKSTPALDLVAVEEASPFSSTSLLQLAAVEQLPRAVNEVWFVWNLGPQAPSGGWRAIRVDKPAA
jgi:hypothetical protein